MFRLVLAAVIVASSVASAHAQSFRLRGDRVNIPVNAISNTQFEVVRSAFAGPANMWCAAGTYAESVLGQRSGNLWVERGLAPSASGRSMIFSTTAVSPEKTTYGYSLNTDGVVKSLASALAACRADPDDVVVRTANGSFRARN